MRTLWQRTFKLRVAINMLVCAIVFGAFGSLPRETISGFLGRKGAPSIGKRPFPWYWLMALVDKLHKNETSHCYTVACEEDAGWRAMYPERYQ